MILYADPVLKKAEPELSYLFRVLGKNLGQHFELNFSDDNGEPTIGISETNHIQISPEFVDQKLSAKDLGDGCMFHLPNGAPDLISTSFFMLTSLQEYGDTDKDELGRFKFENSYQSKFLNAKENVVQSCFNGLAKLLKVKERSEHSAFFLTHDIDLVHGAFVEDGFNVLKRGRIDQLLKLLFNAAIGRPDWLNMEKIMKIEDEHDCKSTFFWIVNKGLINKRERNADYTFRSPKIQRQFRLLEQQGFENGIHKSISSETFEDEIRKYKGNPLANRYHYLKFHLPEGFDDVENAGLRLDTSLGFAEEIGFRSSYGLPYNPFNFKMRKPYSFVEAPLNVMDRTFFQYKKYDLEAIRTDLFKFLEHNKTNAVITVLWHNNFFTEYKFKGYLSLYKQLLSYIRDNNYRTVTQKEVVEQYSIV